MTGGERLTRLDDFQQTARAALLKHRRRDRNLRLKRRRSRKDVFFRVHRCPDDGRGTRSTSYCYSNHANSHTASLAQLDEIAHARSSSLTA